MEKPGLYLLLIISLHYMLVIADSAADPASINFIKSSCRATRYPALCVHCLSSYAAKIQQSEKQLARIALAVSLARARSTAAFVSKMTKVSGMKPREYQALRDCVDNMGDTVDQLTRSNPRAGPNRQVRGPEFHVAHEQCANLVVSVAQVTSNALALVNRFAARHHQAATVLPEVQV
ncbi:plant invertase/pectin methylesterase inhibitor superfamily protein [Actinidia rufa]|uniref:Plant invertase/pectin methylesterase inhibitor superfamily protein n=1 Tax=Actinidia rufa TaxID=165716 RepID=A0A7J0G8B7_9ERIC|nr:plant invertase/pectin methylesterase inhibitor superfamily protein [Actinidia rufa]